MKKFLSVMLVASCAVGCAFGLAGCGCEHPNLEGGKVISTTATCTEAGVETVECPSCKEKIERNVEAYGHTYRQIDKNGANFSGDGENWHCLYCHQPLILLSEKQTLPVEVKATFAGNSSTVTGKIKIKNVNLSVYSTNDIIIEYVCEVLEGSSANAYYGFHVKVTDKSDAARVCNRKVRHSDRTQERQLKAGDEFKMYSQFHMNGTNFANGEWGSSLNAMENQLSIELEFSDLTLSASDL